MALTAAQLTRLGSFAGETHKNAADRQVTDDQLQLIADDSAKVPDSSGFAPSHASYTDTYDLFRAASEAWRWKAGIVAENYDFIAEGGEFKRAQVYAHYMEQSKRYAGMAGNLSPVVDSVEDWWAV
jgi:hypothetical protein